MARIPDAEVQRLKNEVALQRLVEAAGVKLRRVVKDLSGKCPFHADDTASLVVTLAKNLWHCFGCQCGGGPIDWVMKLKGISFRHAVELLKDDSSLAAGGVGMRGEPVKRSTVRALPPPVSLDADDRALLVQVVDYYHGQWREYVAGFVARHGTQATGLSQLGGGLCRWTVEHRRCAKGLSISKSRPVCGFPYSPSNPYQ